MSPQQEQSFLPLFDGQTVSSDTQDTPTDSKPTPLNKQATISVTTLGDNPWAVHQWPARGFTDEQKKADVEAGYLYARNIYDDLRLRGEIENINNEPRKDLASLCAEEALSHGYGRSIAALEGPRKWLDMVFEHFNERNWWGWKDRKD